MLVACLLFWQKNQKTPNPTPIGASSDESGILTCHICNVKRGTGPCRFSDISSERHNISRPTRGSAILLRPPHRHWHLGSYHNPPATCGPIARFHRMINCATQPRRPIHSSCHSSWTHLLPPFLLHLPRRSAALVDHSSTHLDNETGRCACPATSSSMIRFRCARVTAWPDGPLWWWTAPITNFPEPRRRCCWPFRCLPRRRRSTPPSLGWHDF